MRLLNDLRSYALILACAVPLAAEPPKAENPFSEKDRSWWAFQPIQREPAPAVDQAHPVDAFITAKLAAKELSLNEPADKVTLLRRATFDLTGLPPTPSEVEAFLSDSSPDAFDKVIDRLLASPQYGERWARHWLDLARYAESNGFKSDETRPHAWRYRDYVINSFNSDKPYDRFVTEQIAGDEMFPGDPWARVATGFHRHYPDESNAANLQQRRAEQLQDVTDAVASTFLGLTVGCAKCHDHKFDSILQKDYYRLQAFFAHTAEDDRVVMLTGEELATYNRKLAEWETATADIRAEMDVLLADARLEREGHLRSKRTDLTKAAALKPVDELTPFERQMMHKHNWQFGLGQPTMHKKLNGPNKERWDELQAELAKFEDLHPGEAPIGVGVRDLGTEAPPTHVLGLANYAVPQEEVEPGFLTILSPGPAPVAAREDLGSTGRRTALAKWLSDPSNPLPARVMANRIWHYHFGQGIVGTPSDFGKMGERPTHPELLDWLSAEFVENGWSVKHMHRLIMTSQTYRQAAKQTEIGAKKDPFNRLLWRFPPHRLEGEVIRDSMLAVAGKLNPAVGGPSVMPPLPHGMPIPRGGWDSTLDPEEQNRRSIYIFVRRNARFPMMEAFDMPDTHESCARRNVTITAPQALALLNDEQTIEWARAFAGRVLGEAGDDRLRQVEQAYLLAYNRTPDGFEKDAALTFFEKQREVIAKRQTASEPLALPEADLSAVDPAAAAALVDFCHALMNSNEFVYVH